MARAGSTKKNAAFRLPQSGQAFFTELKRIGYAANFAAGTLNKKGKSPPPEVQQMLHYSYPGLAHGRPLNKVMIVLVGRTGAGKSTTINALFNDPICKTSSIASETRVVTEYGKELCVTDPNLPSVIGTLSFVDPPGALDVDHSKEATNLAIITKFRDKNPDLRARRGILKDSLTIREYVYPNLVLMTVNATDNRMEGPDSNLRKCLRALEKYRFLDRLYPNLLVVVTHAMTIPPRCYKQDKITITRVIQEAVFNVLRLRKVEVVFVENDPERYDMTKPEGCDFYALPDGELSHCNLIAAMEKVFDESGDILGKLLCGWYFTDDCPEKQLKANVLNSVEQTNLTHEETEEALQMLASIDLQLSNDDDIVPSTFKFQYLGHGYCPKSESPKKLTVYPEHETSRAKFLNTLYTVPNCFQVQNASEDQFSPIFASFDTKEAYEEKRAATYGLENDVKLVVHVDTNGRWVKDASNNRDSVMRAVFEKRLVFAKIENPETNIKKELMDALNSLPDTFDQQTVSQFQEFFHTCGSHYVEETWLGGHVTIDTPVKTATHNERQGLQMVHKLKTVLKNITSPERGQSEYGNFPVQSDDKEIRKCTLALEGGDPPQITTLTELTGIRYTDWIETVKRYPVELQYSLKLRPYYSLVTNTQKRLALTNATKHYLEDKMLEPPSASTEIGKYANLFQQIGPNPRLIAEELRMLQTGGCVLPSQMKRDVIGNKMVEQTQIEVQQEYSTCVIL